jgi:peptidoglycan/LPS O-acetylase OafA/YrhL
VPVALLMLFSGLVVANYRGGLALGGPLTHLALALLFGLLLLYVLSDRDSLFARIMRWRALARLGTISYGVYLLHTSLSGLLHTLIRGARPSISDWQGAMVTLLALATTLLLAQVSFTLFEKRFIRFGHRYRYK